MPKIILDGQEITLSEAQCATDEILINTLVPYYPAIGGAEIKREADIIRIVKTAGTKGNVNDIISQFKQANHCLNPALELTWQLRYLEIQQQLNLADLLNLQTHLEQAITKGEDALSQVQEIVKNLQQANAIPTVKSMFI